MSIGAESNWELDVAPEPAAGSPVESAGSPPGPEAILEALLFLGGPPLTWVAAKSSIRGITDEQFHEILERLNDRYRRQGRPYGIERHGGGHVLQLRPRYRNVAERIKGQTRQARLSTQAVDVLALVAYRQPAAKTDIDAIRGSDSGALLRQLVRRGLLCLEVKPTGTGREALYSTTPRFLEMFGLSSLEDLPQTQDLQRL